MLGQVRVDDDIACCAGKGEWMIVGIGKASSEYFIDDRKKFLGNGLFPDRFEFRAKQLASSNEVSLIEILDKLSFVSNIAHWSVYFRNGIVKISDHDWDLIASLVRK